MGAIPGFLLILLGFGFLIFIHELGHFLAAKWAGIRADGFAIGMGPCVVSYRRGVGLVLGSADAVVVRTHGRRPIEMSDSERERLGLGETEYSLRALPLGGYVRMLGQEDGNPGATSEDSRSFGKAPIFRRGVVILAGIAANLALAVVLFLIAFLAGVRFPAPTIGGVATKSPAANAKAIDGVLADEISTEAGLDGLSADGLRPGDTVVAIDGEPTQTFLDLRLAAAMAKPNVPLEITVARGDSTRRFSVLPERDPAMGLLSIGVDPARSATVTDVRASRDRVRDTIAATLPALSDAGVGPGATAIAVDGTPVGSFADLERAASGSGGKPITVTWRVARDTGARATDGDTEIDVAIEPSPLFERLVSIAADGTTLVEDAGLAGFVPLVRVTDFAESSLNRETLEKGDVILRVGSTQGPRLSELQRTLRGAPRAAIPALVLRNGNEVAVTIRTDAKGLAGIFLAPAYELPLLANSVTAVTVGSATESDGKPVTRATAAAAINPLPLGRIEAIDGASVTDFFTMRAALVAATATAQDASAPRTLRVTMRDPSPDAAPADFTLTLAPEDVAALRRLSYAFPLSPAIFDPNFTVLSANGNPLKAISMGFRQTFLMVEQVFLTLDRVGRGSVGVEQLQGPVGILHTGTQVADEGFMYVLFFLALISVNLGVVNALPIPIADGGLFMFLIYEKIRGKPPSIAFQNAAAMAGIALVAGIFLLTFYNDLVRLFA